MSSEDAARAAAAGASSRELDVLLQALASAQSHFCAACLHGPDAAPGFEPLFRSLVEALAADPARMAALQARYYAEQLALLRALVSGDPLGGSAEPERDPRFRAPEWRELPWFAYVRHAYALGARWLQDLIGTIDTDPQTRRRLAFHAQQFIDAVAPSNFAMTNPEALKAAFTSGGASFARGLQNLRDDMAKGRVSMTDERAYEVGRNIAVTPGAVV
jgi:polyhydroxyalkanoate synthase